MIWTAVLVAGAGSYLLKLLGVSVPASWLARPLVDRVADLLPVALLAALIGVQTFGEGSDLTVDARLAGLGVALVALLARAPFIVVVVLAAGSAAALRAL
jgi:branched-subunit amino acid transport protein